MKGSRTHKTASIFFKDKLSKKRRKKKKRKKKALRLYNEVN